MSNEPEKNIEQRLQEYAQQRREQAGPPLELHPATRKMLQDEVARTLAPASPATDAAAAEDAPQKSAGWLTRLWPQLAFGGAVLASLMFIVFAVVMDGKLKREAPNTMVAFRADSPATTEALTASAGQPVRDKDGDVVTAVPSREVALATTPADPRNLGRADVAQHSTTLDTVQAKDQLNQLSLATDKETKLSVKLEKEKTVAMNERKVTLEDEALARAKVPDPAKRMAGIDVEKQLADRNRDVSLLQEQKDIGAARAENRRAEPALRNLAPSGATGGGAGAPSGPPAAPKPVTSGDLAKAAKTDALVVESAERPALLARSAVKNPAPPPPPAAPLPAASPAANEARGYFANGVERQQFSQQFNQLDTAANYRQNYNSPPFPKVLKTFQVEVNDGTVRITDSDGSTYEGQIAAAAGAQDDRAEADKKSVSGVVGGGGSARAMKARAAAPAPTDPGGDAGIAFEASGLNRTLNKTVVFRGRFVQGADANGFAENGARQKLAEEAAVSRAVNTPAADGRGGGVQNAVQNLPATQIRGRAIVGGTSQYDISAVPAAPTR